MISPFVIPQVVRLPLPGGHWIDVKREITFGEQEEMFARMRRQMAPGEVPVLDTTRIRRSRMQAYVVGWSFVDPAGRPVPVGDAGFSQLTPDMGKVIAETLDTHEEHVLAEREAEKNAPDGATV